MRTLLVASITMIVFTALFGYLVLKRGGDGNVAAIILPALGLTALITVLSFFVT